MEITNDLSGSGQIEPPPIHRIEAPKPDLELLLPYLLAVYGCAACFWLITYFPDAPRFIVLWTLTLAGLVALLFNYLGHRKTKQDYQPIDRGWFSVFMFCCLMFINTFEKWLHIFKWDKLITLAILAIAVAFMFRGKLNNRKENHGVRPAP